jgi:SAM-dependent methyltransferase
MTDLEYYEKVYYSRQVEGRGLTSPQDLKRAFDAMADHYNEVLLPLLPPSHDAACLDLACGYGNFLYYLRQRGYSQAQGVDLDPRQANLARSLHLHVEVLDAQTALARGQQFDLISTFDLIEHLDKNAAVRLLEAAHLALRPDGRLIVQCPCADGFTGCHDLCNDLTHKWAPTSNMLGQLLRTVGFRDVRIIDLSLPPFPNRMSRRIKYALRHFARKCFSIQLKILGIKPPSIWSNSVLAVAFR